jgi:hypothetical protein
MYKRKMLLFCTVAILVFTAGGRADTVLSFSWSCEGESTPSSPDPHKCGTSFGGLPNIDSHQGGSPLVSPFAITEWSIEYTLPLPTGNYWLSDLLRATEYGDAGGSLTLTGSVAGLGSVEILTATFTTGYWFHSGFGWDSFDIGLANVQVNPALLGGVSYIAGGGHIISGDAYDGGYYDPIAGDYGKWSYNAAFDACGWTGPPVPEPSTLVLVGTGLAALWLRRRRQGRTYEPETWVR